MPARDPEVTFEWEADGHGIMRARPRVPSDIRFPAQCSTCGVVYCMGKAEVTARYADCWVWNCPGCGAQHDSRHAWGDRRPGARMGYIDLHAARDERRRP